MAQSSASLNTAGNYDANRQGDAASGSLINNIGDLQVVVSANYFNKIDTVPFLWGNDYDEIEEAEGYEFEPRLNFRLLKLRNGFWNPNLAFGDLHGSIYAQHSNLQEEITSYGGEVGLDMGAAWMIKLNLVMGANYVEDEVKKYVRIGMGF